MACLPTKKRKKKKLIVKATKMSTPALESPSSSTPSVSNSTDSFAQASEGDSSSLRLNPSDPRTCPSEPEQELIALKVINEAEEEEDMSNDLRAGFKERHHKCLHEAIDMVPPPAKRACPERAWEELGREVPPMLVPPPDAARPNSMPAVEKEAGLAPGEAFGGAAPIEEVLDQKDTPAPPYPPIWDEMMEILKRVSCFTDAEPPSTKMSDFFPLTKRNQ